MKFYLTGGAVRDQLLKLPIRDKDYIIIDANKERLQKLGFIPVGNSYEVFLHPETKEEYAVAADNDLTKELKRRDLTINSIAYDIENNKYIDPFNGINDIENRVLKHTSIHFKDDPIRILRLARFKAQFKDFRLSKETENLCRELSRNNDLFLNISGERFLLELKKALLLEEATGFFETLKEWGTLELFFKELTQLDKIPQRKDYHPEGDCWIHTMLVLKEAIRLSDQFSVRFSSLVHDLGNGITPKEILPSHLKHEVYGVPLVSNVCDRFKVDSYTKKLALAVCKNHLLVHQVFELKPATIHDLLVSFNSFREGSILKDVLLCCKADARGRGEDHKDKDYPQMDFLIELSHELSSTSFDDLKQKYEGEKLGQMIREKRIELIRNKKLSLR